MKIFTIKMVSFSNEVLHNEMVSSKGFSNERVTRWSPSSIAMALPPAFGLCVLPPELLLRVLRLLDAPSLVALSATNRRLHGVAADFTLWRHLYVRDFRGRREEVCSV